MTASTVGGVSSSYTYDGLGRRVHETAGASTYFYYSQSGQQIYSSDATTRHHYIQLAGSLVAKRSVAISGGATTVRYQHTDALGSPVAETSVEDIGVWMSGLWPGADPVDAEVDRAAA